MKHLTISQRIIKKLNFLKLIIFWMTYSRQKLKNLKRFKTKKEKKRYLMIFYNNKIKILLKKRGQNLLEADIFGIMQ